MRNEITLHSLCLHFANGKEDPDPFLEVLHHRSQAKRVCFYLSVDFFLSHVHLMVTLDLILGIQMYCPFVSVCQLLQPPGKSHLKIEALECDKDVAHSHWMFRWWHS